MCDQDHFEEDLKEYEARGLVTRKQFGGILGAAAVAMMLPKVANAVTVTESEVTIKTPDGTCDAYFVHPSTGTAPGVVFWPDIFGLRPAMRQMGKRLAESGYSVVVVNPFYRKIKGTTSTTTPPIAEMMPQMQALNETTHFTDAKAFVAWLDQQPSVAKNRKMGTQGYCMGGPMALRTAAASDRVGAAASFHGAGLVTTEADEHSPHNQVAKMKARLLIAIAENDDKSRPKDKDIMRAKFAEAKLTSDIAVYTAAHGWCAIDSQVYNQGEAEKAWTKLLDMYKNL